MDLPQPRRPPLLLCGAEDEAHGVEAGFVGAIEESIKEVRKNRVASILPYRDDALGARAKQRFERRDARDLVTVVDHDAAPTVSGACVEHPSVTEDCHEC